VGESTPTLVIQHAKLIPLPKTHPLNLNPGTFYAATLGSSRVDGVGIYPHEAQSIEEYNVLVGEPYSIIARDGEWCVIEKNGHRGSVPALCITEFDASLPKQIATCIYDYHRRSGKELSLKRGTVLTVLETYQHWCKVQDGEQVGLVPMNYIILSTCNHYEEIVRLYTPAESLSTSDIHEKFRKGLEYLEFWESKVGKSSNIDSSVKKLAENTKKLVRNLFGKDSAYVHIVFEGPLSDKVEERIQEFCSINLARQNQYGNLQSKNEKFDLVRTMIRKNYALLMKVANVLLQDPNVGSLFEVSK
jgi:hypothetical protein